MPGRTPSRSGSTGRRRSLREIGIPVEYVQSDEQGRDGYYIPREQYFHTELDLTPDEAAVLVMLANSARGGNDAISSNLRSALLKMAIDSPLQEEVVNAIAQRRVHSFTRGKRDRAVLDNLDRLVRGGRRAARRPVPVPEAPTYYIGNVAVYGDASLSPMDGFSDWPYRSICRSLGSAMSYTEFIRAEFLVRAFKHMKPRMKYDEEERPVAIQIYGHEPDEIVAAALRVQEVRPDLIDINMGCPARTVASRGAGVGLMRHPLKVARLFRKLSAVLETPVTAKIRIGWEDCRNYMLIARIVEENGGAALAFHARTKEQGYGGKADCDGAYAGAAAAQGAAVGQFRQPGDGGPVQIDITR